MASGDPPNASTKQSPASANIQAKKSFEDASDTDVEYDRLRRDSKVKRLDRYRRLEELSWTADAKQLQNLVWLLRTKHEESETRARGAGRASFLITTVAALVCLAGAAGVPWGWHRIISFIGFEPEKGVVVPERLWEIVIATSAAILLIGASATLLFRVANNFDQRRREHESEADFTRQIDAAIRLVLASSPKITEDVEVSKGMQALAVQLLKRKKRVDASETPEMSAVPSSAKDIVELAEKIKALASKKTE